MSKIETSEFRVTSKLESESISIETIFDTMYSAFSFQVIQKYIPQLALTTFYNIKKYPNNTNANTRTFQDLDEDINQQIIRNEFSSLILLQGKNKENKNPFLPITLEDTVYFKELLKFYFLHKSKVIHNEDMDAKDAEKYAKNVFNELTLDKVFPALCKTHTPPLMLKEVKHYQVQQKETNFRRQVQSDSGIREEKDVHFRLMPKDSKTFADLSVEDVTIIYRLKNINDYVDMKLERYLIESENKILEEKFSEAKNKKYPEVVFTLLALYDGFGLHYELNYLAGLITIKNEKLKKLCSSAVTLLGTPIRTKNSGYFSLFPHVEQYFGSVGSFYDAQVVSGTYSILPVPTFVFISYCIDRIEKWLNDAQKKKKDLKILFWLPKMNINTSLNGISGITVTKNNNVKDTDILLYDKINSHLKNRLDNIKHTKETINYAPNKNKVSDNDFVYKVYVFSTNM